MYHSVYCVLAVRSTVMHYTLRALQDGYKGGVSEKKRFTKEVSKGGQRMPRLPEAKKDVVSCEKARGSANRT